jgi:mannose-6-phosphate isomerase-like protein (cupin superfamily)
MEFNSLKGAEMQATGAKPMWFIDNLAAVRLDGAATNETIDIVEIEGRAGDMPPLHVHHDHDETFYVVEGTISIHLPDGQVTLREGESLLAPRGVPHVYRVESGTARWLGIGTPAGFAEFVREASDEPESDGFPPLHREHDVERLAEAAVRQGIELLGPPGTLPAHD